ncbi:hypothetical protein ACS0TY_024728 [Phlomoides rotata]
MSICITDHSYTSESYSTYDVSFFNDSIFTTVTHDPDGVCDWISDIEYIHRRRLHRLIVGLDVEWRPSFSRGFFNPVATLQICVGRRCLIYQIPHSPYIPQALVDFLSDSEYTFVGVGVGSDLNKLENDYGFGGDAHAVDLGWLAAEEYDRRELKNAGLRELGRIVLGVEVEKPRRVTLSRWDNRRLTGEQVQYATVDAFVSFEIGRILNASDY